MVVTDGYQNGSVKQLHNLTTCSHVQRSWSLQHITFIMVKIIYCHYTEYTPLPSLGSICSSIMYVRKCHPHAMNVEVYIETVLPTPFPCQYAAYWCIISEPLIIHAYIMCTHSKGYNVSWTLRRQWSPSVAEIFVTNILSLIGVPNSCCKGRQESTESLSIVCIQLGVWTLYMVSLYLNSPATLLV